MATIKISSKVEAEAWAALRAIARESHQNLSGVLTEAVEEYVQRRRVRPVVRRHMEESMGDNAELGRLLAG